MNLKFQNCFALENFLPLRKHVSVPIPGFKYSGIELASTKWLMIKRISGIPQAYTINKRNCVRSFKLRTRKVELKVLFDYFIFNLMIFSFEKISQKILQIPFAHRKHIQTSKLITFDHVAADKSEK